MSRVLLVHWDVASLEERAGRLRRAGHVAEPLLPRGGASLASLAQDPPAAVVIDLSRAPSQGVAVAVALRQRRATRSVPVVFVDGTPEAVVRAHRLLPDAPTASWRGIAGALRRVMAQRPRQAPIVPGTMDAYSGAPLVKKLGIRAGARVALLGAPPGFERQLEGLPDDVVLARRGPERANLSILFAGSERSLRAGLAGLAARLAPGARLWIAWRKQASGHATDLTQARVRELGLATGLVDFKICAIDSTWSGLCFSRRVKRATKRS